MSKFRLRASLVSICLAFGLFPFAAVAAEEGTSQFGAEGNESSSGGASWGTAAAPAVSASDVGTLGTNQQQAASDFGAGGAASRGAQGLPGALMTAPVKGRAVVFDNGIFLYPALAIGIGYNDNVLGTRSNTEESMFYSVRPEFVAEMKHAGDRYTFSYQGNYVSYADVPSDNYFNHDLWAAMDKYLDSRMRFGVGAGYIERSDSRGSTDRPAGSEPDHWHAPVARFLGVYGAEGAMGRVELEAMTMAKRYDNNRVFTTASDIDINMVSGRFYYRFMPRTSALFEVRNTVNDYTLSTSTQDNTDRRYYVGLTWDATAKTTGTLKVGSAKKDFDSSARPDDSMFSWEAGVRWAPLTYSTVDLLSSRGPIDGTGLGNLIVNTGTTVVWTHRWSGLMSSRLLAGRVSSKYSGVARQDDATNLGFGIFREIGFNYRLGLDWSRLDRDSNQNAYDFKRNTVMLTLEGIL